MKEVMLLFTTLWGGGLVGRMSQVLLSRGVYIYQSSKICTHVEDPCFGISCYEHIIMLMLYVHKKKHHTKYDIWGEDIN
jgi:hypothetical protein